MSLRALAAAAVGNDARAPFDADIAGRLDDLECSGLAAPRDARLALATRGARVLIVTRALRRLLGVQP